MVLESGLEKAAAWSTSVESPLAGLQVVAFFLCLHVEEPKPLCTQHPLIRVNGPMPSTYLTLLSFK